MKASVPHFGWTLLADAIAKLSEASGITKQEAARHIITAARDGAVYTRGRLYHAKGHSIAIAPAAWEGMDPDPVMSRLCSPNAGLEVQQPFLGAPVVHEVEIHSGSLEAWKAGAARPPVPIMQPIAMPSALRHSSLVWQELHFAADTKMVATAAAAPVKKSKKATQSLRTKGNPGTKTKRIIAAMTEMDPTELRGMTFKALAHRFGAVPSTCKKARDTVLG